MEKHNNLSKFQILNKYLYLTSKSEGLGLTMIEAMICGTLPIACSDNKTAKEFLLGNKISKGQILT